MFTVILKILSSGLFSKAGNLLTFISKHWKVLLCLGLVLSLCLYIWGLNKKIEKLQVEKFQLSHEYAVLIERCNTNRLNYEQAITEQNQYIDKLNSDLKVKADLIDKIVEENKILQQKLDGELLELFQEEEPETCEESIKFLIDGKKDLKW